jgi:hypothetical protein
MSSFIDLITSAIVFGVLALTVARVQSNINATMYQNQFNVVVQTNAVELARQIEWDFAKIGHHATGPKILFADSTEIRYNADIDNNHIVHSIRYFVGDTSQCLNTANSNDFPLFRVQDGSAVSQNWGLTSFRITYYDDANVQIPTPITNSDLLATIHSVKVAFRLESPEPVVSSADTSWAGVAWEKNIVPRNLGDLTY